MKRILPEPCANCGGRRIVPQKLQVARQHYVEDPYCSRKCAEADHGIAPPTSMTMHHETVPA